MKNFKKISLLMLTMLAFETAILNARGGRSSTGRINPCGKEKIKPTAPKWIDSITINVTNKTASTLNLSQQTSGGQCAPWLPLVTIANIEPGATQAITVKIPEYRPSNIIFNKEEFSLPLTDKINSPSGTIKNNTAYTYENKVVTQTSNLIHKHIYGVRA